MYEALLTFLEDDIAVCIVSIQQHPDVTDFKFQIHALLKGHLFPLEALQRITLLTGSSKFAASPTSLIAARLAVGYILVAQV